jgi:hypothetical protein
MRLFAGTYRDNVTKFSVSKQVSFDVCGGGSETTDPWLIGNGMGAMLWDDTGKLAQRVDGQAALAQRAGTNVIYTWVWHYLNYITQGQGLRPSVTRAGIPSRGGGGAATETPAPFIILNPDFTWYYAATPTHTAQPTGTAAPTATSTATTAPTGTPEPTATASLEPTPTQDDTPIQCRGLVLTDEINVRTGPGTLYARIGSIRKDEIIFPVQRDPGTDDAYWWVQFEGTSKQPALKGWAALSYAPGSSPLQTWIQLNADCSGLPQPNQEEKALAGLHLQLNANSWRLAPLFYQVGVVKEVSGSGSLLTFARLHNPRVTTIYRWANDGGCVPPWMDVARWMDLQAAHWPPGMDYYEVINECGEIDRSVSARATIDMMEWAGARGICLLLYSWGVGNPTIEFWAREVPPALDYALAHPCQSGRYHGIALHAYTLGQPLDNLWLNSLYRQLFAAIDLKYRQLPVYITEWGGSYAQESDPVNCARLAEDVAWARRTYRDGLITGFTIWSFGESQVWRDVTNCEGELRAVVQ